MEKQLQRNKMVKVRILPAALQGEVTAQVIAANAAEQTNSALVEVRGHVFILFRKRKAGRNSLEIKPNSILIIDKAVSINHCLKN